MTPSLRGALLILKILYPIASTVDARHRSGRVTHDQCVGLYVSGNDAAGRNHGVLPHRYSADYGAVRTKAGAISDDSWRYSPLFVESSRHAIVGKGNVRSDEHIVSQGHTMVDRDAVLDLATSADSHPMIDVDVLRDDATRADIGILPDLHIYPNLRALPNAGALGNICSRVDENALRHDDDLAQRPEYLWSSIV